MSIRRKLAAVTLAASASACHTGGDDVPLTKQNIYFSDKFFDVKALAPDRAIIVGYGGKILETADGGESFTRLTSGTEMALYDVAAIGEQRWIAGQEGLILHSADGGKTFTKQESGTKSYLFSIFFLDEKRGFAVGDRSVMVRTSDGGKTWTAGVAAPAKDPNAEENLDLELAMQDPVLYDVKFLNETIGYIVGEFGQILRTNDGGANWVAQQATLMGSETGIVDPMDIPTFFGVQILSAEEALVSGLEGRIARTTDAGVTWKFEKLELEYPIVDPLYAPIVTANGTGWAVGAAGEVVTRKPGESVWQRADMGMSLFTWIRSVDFANADNGWLVGGYGNILHTKDGGKTWIQSQGGQEK